MKAVVVFDLDGTLIKHDSFVAFLLFVLKCYPTRWLRTWKLPFAVLIHKVGARDNTWLKATFLRSIVGGLSVAALEAVAHRFSERLLKATRSAAKECIATHKADNDLLILATASPHVYVEPFADALGFDLCVCTNLEIADDKFTGELASDNCYGPNKLQRLKGLQTALLPKGCEQIDLAYSDHQADIPLLTEACKGVAVSPTPKLRAMSARHDIEVVQWD